MTMLAADLRKHRSFGLAHQWTVHQAQINSATNNLFYIKIYYDLWLCQPFIHTYKINIIKINYLK